MLVVQKFGGATLSDAKKIRQVAERIAGEVRSGKKIVAVVSAMGSSTNSLIALAHEVSSTPSLREMDMLLSVGERISMSLLSMALNELGIKATSLTGSQAGILTNNSHSNAFIVDVKGLRVQEALQKSSVVVLAGFQGVSPQNKEITTLGRGGTDTTALAMATFLKANHCEILKDVAAIYSADPRLVKDAREISALTYEQLCDMTFWGAKVMHFRSAELAANSEIPVYVGPAHNQGSGTWIRSKNTKTAGATSMQNENAIYEKPQVLSINSHEKVFSLDFKIKSPDQALEALSHSLEQAQISEPQILSVELINIRAGENTQTTRIWLTAPSEVLDAIQKWLPSQKKDISDFNLNWCTVTATCSGSSNNSLIQICTKKLLQNNISFERLRCSPQSLSFFVDQKKRIEAIQVLHSMTENN